jgi:hypothetical protein
MLVTRNPTAEEGDLQAWSTVFFNSSVQGHQVRIGLHSICT